MDSVIFLQASDSIANVDGMHPNTFFQGLKTYVNTDASVAFLAREPGASQPGRQQPSRQILALSKAATSSRITIAGSS